jgi:hypothetical protein
MSIDTRQQLQGMARITPAQIKMLQVQRRVHGMDDETYRAMLHEATGGRTTSTRELTQAEALALISGLVPQTPADVRADKMRRKILGFAREMGWTTDDDRVDIDRVNQWCVKYGYGHKPLNRYTYHELPKLVTQFENGPYKSYLSRI